MNIVPTLTFSFVLNGIAVNLQGNTPQEIGKISYVSGYDQLLIRYTSDMSLQYIEARITADGTDYGIGIGTLVDYSSGSISANTQHTLTLNSSSTIFTSGDGVYRLSIYAKNSIDGTWNQTHFFITASDEVFMAGGVSDYQTNVGYNSGTYFTRGGALYEVVSSFTAEQNTSWSAIEGKVELRTASTNSVEFMVPTTQGIPS